MSTQAIMDAQTSKNKATSNYTREGENQMSTENTTVEKTEETKILFHCLKCDKLFSALKAETAKCECGELAKPETKEHRFHRVASFRLKKTLAYIATMENLASAQYKSTEAQVEYINDQLSGAVCRLYDRLNKVKDDKTIAVELPV